MRLRVLVLLPGEIGPSFMIVVRQSTIALITNDASKGMFVAGGVSDSGFKCLKMPVLTGLRAS